MVISTILGIFMPMSIAVYSNCDYYQEVEIGQRYYIYNKEYPDWYPAGTACRWVAHSKANTKIVLSCEDIDIPKVRILFRQKRNSQLYNNQTVVFSKQ